MNMRPKHVAGTLKTTKSYVSRSLTSDRVLNDYVLLTHEDEAKSSGYDTDEAETSSKLHTEAAFSSETSEIFYHITRRHTPEYPARSPMSEPKCRVVRSLRTR